MGIIINPEQNCVSKIKYYVYSHLRMENYHYVHEQSIHLHGTLFHKSDLWQT